jgi:PAS domain S-box-containing protein
MFFKDITPNKIKELNLKLEKGVLRMNTDSNFTLKEIVDYYLAELGSIYPGQRLAVNLVDKKGLNLIPLSSPQIPDFCRLFSAGFPVVPIQNTCCEATFYKKISGICDISSQEIDPLFKQFAIDNSIDAVWSFPITNEKDKVLATVAAFYSSAKVLSEQEEDVIKRIITFIQILIESHQTREFLEMNIERYRLVTQSAKDAIYDWDISQDELYWGEGMEKAFGYRNPTTSLHWWEEKVHPEDLPGLTESLDELLADAAQNCWHTNYRFLRSDGTYAYIVEDGFVIRNDKGKAIRMVGAMQDHTSVIENQLQILKQNNSLREIARINSHYIRKPLANILALVEAIKACEGEELQELINMLELSGYELDEITRQIARKAYY